ncbi:MAG: response regulator transcription factor [Flavobacteriales bacterium]|nr:MAG: response regulator transcription factor [Flavobacteriales bacterium]
MPSSPPAANGSPDVPVALIDDHTLVRKGLVEVINGLGGYKVVLEAAHGLDYKEKVNGGPRIELAIVDLNMPVMDGYQTLDWIRTACPETRALALTFDGTDDAIIRAVRSGARGFVLKDVEPHDLKTALDHISATGYYHTELVHQSLMHNFDKKTSDERARDKVLEQITPRELEFLKLVCDPKEFTYEQIGDLMGVHRRTVDGFRQNLFERFGIRSKTGLVLFAVRWGVVKV